MDYTRAFYHDERCLWHTTGEAVLYYWCTKRWGGCRSFPACLHFILQIGIFLKWAMLGSNQRPLPCEVRALSS